MIHVINKIERPSKELINQFREIGSATVHEASGRKGAVNPAVKPIARGVRICGPVFTIQCHPGDNLMLHKALERAQPGDVLVASVGDYYDAGYWGGLMATSGMAKELGGLAIDGCIRDSEEIIEMGFPIFCRGFCIWGTTKAVLGLINHPIIFGGVLVNPGDLILGDDDGIVVVNRKECEAVLDKSIKRIKAEQMKAGQLKAGVSSVELNKLDKVFESLGLIEE
ncbi:MAG TPA: 4-carboxy-4-hydroxy-2-oxoadipate aldolase/oxaloacetate decarboxylase [Thermodesulfobacteriota bacterium]|nr:4-carboxy-4-hydroxy-2-oxoadipate aldolase/oxaloacetate decarboxylase [Thermodesulfobacteriota bacterium]